MDLRLRSSPYQTNFQPFSRLFQPGCVQVNYDETGIEEENQLVRFAVCSLYLSSFSCMFICSCTARSFALSFFLIRPSFASLFIPLFLSHRFTFVTPLFVPLFLSLSLHLFVPPLIPSSLHSLNPPLTPAFVHQLSFIYSSCIRALLHPLPLDPSTTPSSSINSIIDTLAIPRPLGPLVPPVTPAAIPRSFRHIHSFPSSATVAGATTQEARKRDLIFEGVRRQRRQRSPACLCFPRVCSLFGSATGN